MIKAKDHSLHLINITIPGFLNPSPTPEGIQQVELPFQYTVEEEATPSQPTIKEEEKEEEEVVEVSNFEDDFKVFN